MAGEIYGYIRVSTKEQNEDRQRIAMREYGVPEKNVYIDKQSGKDFDRPGYRRLRKVLKEGVCPWSLQKSEQFTEDWHGKPCGYAYSNRTHETAQRQIYGMGV